MRRWLGGALGVLGAMLALGAGPAAASPAPAWAVHSLATPTHFKPGEESGVDLYEVILTNNGGAVSDGSPIEIVDTLPAGLGVKKVELLMIQPKAGQPVDFGASACGTQTVGEVATVSCKVTESLSGAVAPAKVFPSAEILLVIHLAVPPSAAGALVNQVKVEGGGEEVAPVSAESHNEASDEDAGAGFQVFESALRDDDGIRAMGADSHPYEYTTSFAVNTELSPPIPGLPTYLPAGGNLKEVEVALPPGLIGSPTATPERCTAQQFNSVHSVFAEGGLSYQNDCPDGSAVGLAVVQQLEGGATMLPAPIYNLVPPHGVAAQLGFEPTLGLPVYINARLRSESDFGVTAYVRNTTEAKRVTAGAFTLWGTPAEESHDRLRGRCAAFAPGFSIGLCGAGGGTPRPFMRLPSSCADPLITRISFDTWADPGDFLSESSSEAPPVGCAAPDFSPSFQAQPSTDVADSPTGLQANLHLPQLENEDPAGLAEADLRDVNVTLPRGLAVNPASVDGLAACAPAQIGLKSGLGEAPIHFDESPAVCPDASKVASVEAITPLLDHTVRGAVYLAKQSDNPFGSLLAIYMALEDPETGVVVKLAGKVTPDPQTGQLTTSFAQNPQLPVEDFKLHFFEGPRAALRTPPACGKYETKTELVPWTAPEGEIAEPSDSFQISSGPAGPCPTGALAPKLLAGLKTPSAATYSPFSLRLSREDASGEFRSVNATTPKGLVARLAGIPYCPEAAIAQALSRSAPGEGALEAVGPSCPAASQVGTTTAGAGAGPDPFYTAGKVYLAAPYKNAPLSLVALVPAIAGPFDLGVVVDRIALHINPESAQVSAQADPLPTILAGIPLDIRDIRLDLDRPNFTLAPTSCAPQSVEATVFSPNGASAQVSNRFQVGNCKALGFKPKLSLALKGSTKRAAYPAFRAVLTYPQGAYANTATASVALPHSEFLAQEHIHTICTRVQFAANACPAGSIYGRARASSPLLAEPVKGPVYLRASSHPLPDLVVALHGQVDADAVGRIDSHKGGIRTTFEGVPDVPISKFVLEMPGGRKGLLVNSTDICKHPNRATANFIAQNGKAFKARPPLRSSCKGAKVPRRRY